MFFFQDDIGILIQLQQSTFWHFLLTSISANFAPIMQFIYFLEYKLFNLNYSPYVLIALLMHLGNCLLVGKTVSIFTKERFLIILAVSLFAINLTYTEPFLWWAAQGVLLATFLTGLTFIFWYRYVRENKFIFFIFSLIFSIGSGLSYASGTGLGVIFGLVTLIYNYKLKSKIPYKIIFIYLLAGFLSFIIAPLIAHNYLSRVLPVIKNPISDFILYLSFIGVGISRGVVGRLFLPGFEPRHFQIIPTIISFLPFVIICLANLLLLMIKGKRQEKMLLFTLSIFITYPYVWAGFLRSHFGLKQALAERYAYPSLFFFCIFLVLLIKQLIDRGFIESRRLIAIFAVVILILQSLVFIRNAIKFEEKPLETKDYFEKLERVLQSSATVIDFSLPSYINQEYRISQLSTVLKVSSFPKYVLPNQDFCTAEFLKGFKREEILSFYKEQVKDPIIVREFPEELLNGCLSKVKKSV